MFWKKKPIKKPNVFQMGGGWGDCINQWKEDSIYGFKTPLPQNGDLLIAKTKLGKIGVFVIYNVRPQSDPSDMFFADVRFLRYCKNTTDIADVQDEKTNMLK